MSRYRSTETTGLKAGDTVYEVHNIPTGFVAIQDIPRYSYYSPTDRKITVEHYVPVKIERVTPKGAQFVVKGVRYNEYGYTYGYNRGNHPRIIFQLPNPTKDAQKQINANLNNQWDHFGFKFIYDADDVAEVSEKIELLYTLLPEDAIEEALEYSRRKFLETLYRSLVAKVSSSNRETREKALRAFGVTPSPYQKANSMANAAPYTQVEGPEIDLPLFS